MYRRMQTLMLVYVGSLLLSLLSGCSTSTSTSIPAGITSSPTTSVTQKPTSNVNGGNGNPSSTALQLVNSARRTMMGVQSYHFETKNDPAQSATATFSGDYAQPDRYRFTTNFSPKSKADMLKIGQDVYIREGDNSPYRLIPGANPVGGFDPLQPLLSNSLTLDTAFIKDDEQVDGRKASHIFYTYDASQLTGIDSGQVKEEMWIDKQNNYILEIKSASEKDVPALWTFYSKFDEPVSPPIEKP